jgi:hypothetical protein
MSEGPKHKFYEIAKAAMRRRKCEWTEAEEKMWDEIHRMTASEREAALNRGM